MSQPPAPRPLPALPACPAGVDAALWALLWPGAWAVLCGLAEAWEQREAAREGAA